MLPLKPLRMVRVRSDWSEQPWATLREEGPVEIMKSPPDLTVTEIGQSAISASRVADTVMEFNPTAIVSSARTVRLLEANAKVGPLARVLSRGSL